MPLVNKDKACERLIALINRFDTTSVEKCHSQGTRDTLNILNNLILERTINHTDVNLLVSSSSFLSKEKNNQRIQLTEFGIVCSHEVYDVLPTLALESLVRLKDRAKRPLC